jgi:hypothetical protein
MKITLESTSKIVELNGVPARIWEGKTDTGIEVHAFITRLAVHKDDDATQFEVELQEHAAPKNPDINTYPLRMIL